MHIYIISSAFFAHIAFQGPKRPQRDGGENILDPLLQGKLRFLENPNSLARGMREWDCIVKKPKNITQSLRELDAVEKELAGLSAQSSRKTVLTQQILSLRALIPTAILTHFDRMKARGKHGVVSVRNGVCGACHMAIPRGDLVRLRDSDELNVCDCGTFIYLAEEEVTSIESAFYTKGRKQGAKRK